MANRLITEQSPYLLQHAHNPVNWYPWGDAAFEKAIAEHKPVIVSIGYAACHWCHVMERESFENEEVAAYMNDHFVCIKVDREEHPDVDHMYMDAVQAISGSGGWPLNVFVTPERAPFYGGTYYPPRPMYNRPSWMQLLQRMSAIWTHQQDEALVQAEQMIAHLRQASQQAVKKTDSVSDKDLCRKIADSLLAMADKQKGGFGNAPKFPGTMAISFLLEHYRFTGYEPALTHALLSLDSMIAGGIYDQLGGGFARYSTDADWLAPHFEKMLYDNALIVMALCDAYLVTRDEKYKRIIEETIAFAERELKDPSGGYYCAIDADSEGVEGKFYTWTWPEWLAAVGPDNKVAAAYFGVTETGNWEHTNILHVAKSMSEVAAEAGCTPGEAYARILAAKEKLLTERQKRVRPLTDDKCLLPWNALMNMALSKAGAALENQEWLLRAGQHMEWMVQQYHVHGAWMHTWKDGIAKIPAKLDGYAYLIQAMMQLASAGANNQWILQAAALTKIVLHEFSDEGGLFYYTSHFQRDIPIRKIDTYDGATPSGNAVMAHNLWLCGMCMEDTQWIERAGNMLQHISGAAGRHSYSFGWWAVLIQRQVMAQKTVVCAGEHANEAQNNIRRHFFPEIYTLTLVKEISEIPILENKFFAGKLYIFVCTEGSCLSAVSSADAAVSYIIKQKNY